MNDICKIPGCNNKVAAITTGNGRKSKIFCETHTKPIKVDCNGFKSLEECPNKHILMIQPRFYKGNDHSYICKNCSALANLVKANEANKKIMELLTSEQKKERVKNLLTARKEKWGLMTAEERIEELKKTINSKESHDKSAQWQKQHWQNMSEEERIKITEHLHTDEIKRKKTMTLINNGHYQNLALLNKERYNNMSEEEKHDFLKSSILSNEGIKKSHEYMLKNRIGIYSKEAHEKSMDSRYGKLVQCDYCGNIYREKSLCFKCYCKVCKLPKKKSKIQSDKFCDCAFWTNLYTDWINNENGLDWIESNIPSLYDMIINDMDKIGIYSISFNNNIVYIGESTNIQSRLICHAYNIFRNPKLFGLKNYKDIDEITMDILLECDVEELKDKELEFINRYKPLLQKCDGTDNCFSVEERMKIIETLFNDNNK